MSLSTLLSSHLVEGVTAVSALDMILAVLLSFGLGLFISYVYKKTFAGVMYSHNFSVSLVGICMVATILIIAVSSNIVLSLGMVGALSIVRFRTAIKEPLDIVFLFWALSAGIILATGMIPLAVFGSIGIGIVLMTFANRKSAIHPYLLILYLTGSETENAVMSLIKENTKCHVLKGKTFSKDGREELTVEVQLDHEESSFVRELSAMAGVENVSLVSYNGDYMN